MAKAQAGEVGQPSIGSSLSDAKTNLVLETVAKVWAARIGAQTGGSGGASIQTANMASSRMKSVLGRLTSDKASEPLAQSVEDPELFRALLINGKSAGSLDKTAFPRKLPYLIGAGTETVAQED